MRFVVQRISHGAVGVDTHIKASIDQGLVVLVGFCVGDTMVQAQELIDKLVKLRIFSDAAGKMNKSIVDIHGGILLVSQFTLYADCTKGTRPSFAKALAYEEASVLFDELVDYAKQVYGGVVQTGIFGADMDVELCNQGPVTIILEN